MNLHRVTITGADDSTKIGDLVALSRDFPFVEWGILVSKKQEGGYRFPSRDWIDHFSGVALVEDLNVSTHVCGAWVREMFMDKLDWTELPNCIDVSHRVQINTHAEPHVSTVGLFRSLGGVLAKEYIFQWDGVNDHLTYAGLAYGLKVAALFDTSGGAGQLPVRWPRPVKDFPCGYAGGLGPHNVVEQVRLIEGICDQPYWIDMERRVRTDDDSALDLTKVRSVLEAVAAECFV